MQDNVIRPFHPADLAAVYRLIQETLAKSYAAVYPPAAVAFFQRYHDQASLQHDAASGFAVVAERPGEVVGVGMLLGQEIRRVYVHPQCQQQGVGARIYAVLEQQARAEGSAKLELDASLASWRFWERRGFRVVSAESLALEGGQRLDYYRMEKELEGRARREAS